MMKKTRNIRLPISMDNQLIEKANSVGISTSQLIVLACKNLLGDIPIDEKKKILTQNRRPNQIKVTISTSNETFRLLLDTVNKKNSTLSQEVLFRLASSLTNPIFDSMEFRQIVVLRNDLARLGNLLKLTLKEGVGVDIQLLNSIDENLTNVKSEIDSILREVKKRTFKGSLK